ncbi:tRNA lysidine(34) synthetase TilS [Herbaspirillum sp. LeCh32-8]|uniref:tRNA lysidine(34) synthetase TilS n=1 Tax=Herbaspirillum sp. LeCh32-8 TaxID=2821356 RepID=UPI001AE7DF6D|nr:tRNA lysidine(34) synthetase TilS [Herbaspirillum sp. LeCh32-8]MBP0596790.1 tRNA lysidine(34) synthetase TilS [Herbaspirillum sp. LeCh32-8]
MSDHSSHSDRSAGSAKASQALQHALSGALQAAGRDRAHTIALAYSGGLDSSVLLDVAAADAARRGVRLLALHVHHGLSSHADGWLAHCEERCRALGVAFHAERVVLEGVADSGVEEAARVARYAALGRMCRAHGADVLLTAHHLDDQAETVLLQLLRGSGLAGMSGMEAFNNAPGLLGDGNTLVLRPLLAITRAQLEAYAAQCGLASIEDESNADTRYARNALRHLVMPALGQSFPGYQQRLARAAGHAQGAQELLLEVAQQDLQRCRRDDHLLMPALRELSEQRFFNLMRYWFAARGMRMPSSAWMHEMRAQLMQADVEAQLCVSHPDGEVHRYRERVFLAPRRTPPEEGEVIRLKWNGEARLRIDAYYGALHLERIAAADPRPGFDAAWLAAQPLAVQGRSGGERVKLAANRPARSLKQHFQSADVPAWERPYLPLLFAGDDLLFAAGIGMDCVHFAAGGERVAIRWLAD